MVNRPRVFARNLNFAALRRDRACIFNRKMALIAQQNDSIL
jgi:hypothetical protein